MGEEIYVYLADESAADVCTGLLEEGEGEREGGQRSTSRQGSAGSSSLGAAASVDKLPDCSLRGHDGSLKDVTLLLSDDDSDGDMTEVPLMVRLGVGPQQEQEGSYPNPALTSRSNADSSNAVQEELQEGFVCLDVDSNSSSDKESQRETVKRSGGEPCSDVVPSSGSSKPLGVSSGSSSLVGPSTASASSNLTGGSLSSSEPLDSHLMETCENPLQEPPLFTLQPGWHKLG